MIRSMRNVFADTLYWIALANPRDQHHHRSVVITKQLSRSRITTSDDVLSEFLTFFSGKGRHARKSAVMFTDQVLSNKNIEVITQSRESFSGALKLYRERYDKEYSFIDCVSMWIMKEKLGINEIITNDRHFEQEGFKILMKEGLS